MKGQISNFGFLKGHLINSPKKISKYLAFPFKKIFSIYYYYFFLFFLWDSMN